MELSWNREDPAQRCVFWAVLSRQVLAAVERLLAEAGIALDGRDG